MKFYFCQGCGKRITDEDLNEGLGRNKKLRGVYCHSCAVGVTTMDTLPMDEKEAREVLGKKPTEPSPTPQNRSRTRTSGKRLPKRRPSGRSSESGILTAHDDKIQRARQGKAGLVIGAVTIGIIAMLGLILLLTQGSEQQDIATKPKTTLKTEKPGNPKTDDNKHPDDGAATAAKADVPQSEPSPEARADAALTAVLRFEGLAPDDHAGRARRLESFLEKHGTSLAAARARAELRSVKAATTKSPDAGGSSQAPAPASKKPDVIEEPEKPEQTQPEPEKKEKPAVDEAEQQLRRARLAYAQFSQSFLDNLRQRELGAAEIQLKEAEANPALKPIAAELSGDRTALGWARDIRKAVSKGLVKVNQLDDMTIRLLKGKPMRVGRRGGVKITDVKPDRFMVGGKQVSMPMRVEQIHPDSIAELASLGLGSEPADRVKRVFLRMLTARGSTGQGSWEAVASDVGRLKKGGAREQEIAYLTRAMSALRSGALDRAAQVAWGDIETFEKKKETKSLRDALRAFCKDFSQTAFYKQKEKTAAGMLERAEVTMALANGLAFDFKQADSFEGFRKLFRIAAASNMKMLHEQEAVRFRRAVTSTEKKRGAMHLHAPGIRLGRRWTMSYVIDTTFTRERARRLGHSRVEYQVRFMRPGEKIQLRTQYHHRFQLSLSNSYSGFCVFSLRAHGMSDNLSSNAGIFKGMKLGRFGGEHYESSRTRKPASEDGIYKVRLKREDDQFTAVVNDMKVVNTTLPSEAGQLLENSALSFCAFARGGVEEILLKELRFEGGSPSPPASSKDVETPSKAPDQQQPANKPASKPFPGVLSYDFNDARSFAAFQRVFVPRKGGRIVSVDEGLGRFGVQGVKDGKLMIRIESAKKPGASHYHGVLEWSVPSVRWIGDWEFACKLLFRTPTDSKAGASFYLLFEREGKMGKTSGCYLGESGKYNRLYGGLVERCTGPPHPTLETFAIKKRENYGRIHRNKAYEMVWVKTGNRLSCILDGKEICAGQIPDGLLKRMTQQPIRAGVDGSEDVVVEIDDWYLGPIRKR